MNKKKLFLDDLISKDTMTILNALSNLRKLGNPSDINNIIELLHTTNNPEIKESINSFLCDLKEQNSVTFILKAIKNKKYKNEMEILVASCWQSGLDYSAYLSEFTDLLIHENYIVAIEAFTVIENMSGNFTAEEIETNISKINAATKLYEKEKTFLFEELINVLESWKKEDPSTSSG